ncbi:MAG: DUF1559 domain-containing protein [Planctomycetaceae bacterium]
MYDFPPNRILADTPWPTLLMHGVLIAICAIGFWTAIRQRWKKQNRFPCWDFVLFTVGFLLVWLLSTPVENKGIILGYGGVVFLIAVVGSACGNGWFSTNPVSALFCLILLAMIALVVSPAVQSDGSPSRRTACKNNIRQLGLAFHVFHDFHGQFPSASGGLPNADRTDPPVSWRVITLPYVEHSPLFEQYDRSQPWDSAANIRFQSRRIEVLCCPSDPRNTDRGSTEQPYSYPTSYTVPTGDGTIFGDPSGPALSLDEITDGTSNTVMVVEACGTDIVWTEPRDLDVTKTPLGVNLPGSQPGQSDGLLSSYHTTGAHVGMADGSVRFMSKDIDPQVLKKLTTANAADGPVEDW